MFLFKFFKLLSLLKHQLLKFLHSSFLLDSVSRCSFAAAASGEPLSSFSLCGNAYGEPARNGRSGEFAGLVVLGESDQYLRPEGSFSNTRPAVRVQLLNHFASNSICGVNLDIKWEMNVPDMTCAQKADQSNRAHVIFSNKQRTQAYLMNQQFVVSRILYSSPSFDPAL
nr:hypothetical protein Iba_scaffold1681830CG0010 [Ipomoea batatas]